MIIKYVGTLVWLLLAAIAYFYGNGVVGDAAWLLWLAPLLVLSYAYSHSAIKAALFSFLACALGNVLALIVLSLSMPASIRIYYPVEGIASGMVIDSAVFMVGVLLSRWAFQRTKSWLVVWLLPAYWTAYEYLYAVISASGSNDSSAFSQVHWLALIQITSVTGIWAVSFLLLLVPGGIALAWALRKDKRQAFLSLGVPLVLLLAVLAWGHYRIAQGEYQFDTTNSMRVGLLATNETLHDLTVTNPVGTSAVSDRYLTAVKQLATTKPQVILMPEKIVSATTETLPALLKHLKQTARNNHVMLMMGVNLLNGQRGRNALYVVSAKGQLIATYYKQHLVAFGPERNDLPGKKPLTFKLNDRLLGVVICHDLDFQLLGREYGQLGTKVLFVPALDFVADGWQHGRNAIVQGIENGYSVVRAAQWGLLTISDQYGRVLAIKPTSLQQTVSLQGRVPYGQGGTFYSRFGDWFAWLVCLLLVLTILYTLSRKR